ncbi:MAG TPA: oligosaccharide flippase family protein, partial [Candidatus Methylomirabilis sp.]|nr:oligosaccharide flippase family protein [Candidatus Methylomirabilis sp.]
MNLVVKAIKNVSSGWFGMLVNLAVGFFLSPFILHRLGDYAFGLWILAFSLSGYYGLFDLGIRSSIIRYVAKFAASGDYEELRRIVNTSLFSYSCVALVLLVATGVGCLFVGPLFKVSPAYLPTARLLFLMVGSSLALGFPLSVFGGILQGLQEFYWLNLTQVASTLLRALLIVLSLNHGRGLLTVALITVGLPLLSSCAYIPLVLRRVPVHFAR